MKAIILAGGVGTRLAPYTLFLPKPLMPLGDKPILDIIIRQLQHHGITDITLAVSYMADQFISYFGDGGQFGVRIAYSREQESLGTAAPLKLVPGLEERFLVMNGDILTTLNFNALLECHAASGALCTVAVHSQQIPIDFGVVEYDSRFQLTGYTEKPIHRFPASMGIYICEPRVLDFIPDGRHFDLPELMHCLRDAGEDVRCYPFEGYWLDIGRPDDYARALSDVDKLLPQLFNHS